MLILASLAPSSSFPKVQETVRLGDSTRLKYNYKNPTNRKLTFEIGTSHPDFIEPVDTEIILRESEAINLELLALPQSGNGSPFSQNVFIFFTDLENYVMDCVEFEIFYRNK